MDFEGFEVFQAAQLHVGGANGKQADNERAKSEKILREHKYQQAIFLRLPHELGRVFDFAGLRSAMQAALACQAWWLAFRCWLANRCDLNLEHEGSPTMTVGTIRRLLPRLALCRHLGFARLIHLSSSVLRHVAPSCPGIQSLDIAFCPRLRKGLYRKSLFLFVSALLSLARCLPVSIIIFYAQRSFKSLHISIITLLLPRSNYPLLFFLVIPRTAHSPAVYNDFFGHWNAMHIQRAERLKFLLGSSCHDFLLYVSWMQEGQG